jgi:undecaprenyl-phosphate galactose phosphotransferase
MDLEEVGNLNAFKIVSSNKTIYDIVTTVLDFLICIIIFVITLPFWFILILLIKTTSAGPIFYKPEVVGKNGKSFLMYKFRSMYHNADTSVHEKHVKSIILNNQLTKKLQNDNRITTIGRFLRTYSLDEFPQIINVLRGEMKLVGPRPCLSYEALVMEDWHRQRFKVRPGLTGLWQINGRNQVPFNEQIAFDIYYIENRSFRLDIEILLKTIPVVLLGKGGV